MIGANGGGNPMTIREAMREIESREFAARLGVASDFRTFLRAAEVQPAARALLQELDAHEKRQQVFSRILELSRQRVDPRYENQWDTALAIYLWLINLKDLDLARLAAKAVAQSPQCWWAAKVSSHILLGSPMHSSVSAEQHEAILSLSISADAAIQRLSRGIVNVEHRTALEVLHDLIDSFDHNIILAAVLAHKKGKEMIPTNSKGKGDF